MLQISAIYKIYTATEDNSSAIAGFIVLTNYSLKYPGMNKKAPGHWNRRHPCIRSPIIMYFIWFDSIVILVLIVTAHAAIKKWQWH